jgi:SAM-dependent methyltransferase
MRSWTIRRKFRNLAAACVLSIAFVPSAAPATLQTDPNALYRTMKAAFDRGNRDGWPFADAVYYFSTVLDVGRAYELVRRDDPDNAVLAGYALDLATRLHYDPLTSRDAAEWYLRAAAEQRVDDPTFGPRARALLAKLDAERADPQQLARDAVADAAANLAASPNDAEALAESVDASVRAYLITRDPAYRSQALLAAAQPVFPINQVPDDASSVLWAMAAEARGGAPGYTDTDRAAARAMFSHRASAPKVATIGRVLSHDAYLVITAPADEYFGHTKLSPIGVSNELQRIAKYLDAGWGNRMTQDTLWVLDSIEDWQHQYPRDYALPRLLLRAYTTLGRMDSPEAVKARDDVRHELTIDYNGSPEARTLLAGS